MIKMHGMHIKFSKNRHIIKLKYQVAKATRKVEWKLTEEGHKKCQLSNPPITGQRFVKETHQASLQGEEQNGR